MDQKLILLSICLAACNKSDDAKPAPAAAVALDVAGVNALVPAELKAALVFEELTLEERKGKRTFTFAAPKGWTQESKMLQNVRPPKEPDLGFFTKFGVSSECAGVCEPKDWAAVSDQKLFSQFAGGTIQKDEKTATSRLMIAEKGASTYVVYAWWKDGAERYYTCDAALEKPVAAAAPAFAKACQAVAVKD